MIRGAIFLVALVAITGAHDDPTGHCELPPMLKNLMSGSKIFKIKKMFEKEMHSCLKVRPSEAMIDMTKNCTSMKTFQTPEIMEAVKTKEIVEIMKMVKDVFVTCVLDSSGVQYTSTDLDLNELVAKAELDQWMGTVQDLTIHRAIIDRCKISARGDTAMKKHSDFFKCCHFGIIDHCNQNGKEIGMFPAMMSQMLTLDDESPCAMVKVPDEVLSSPMECLKQSVNVDISADVMNETAPILQAFKLAEGYFKKIMMPAMECRLKNFPVKIYDEQTKKVSFEPVSEYIKTFSGWEGKTEEKETVAEAIRICGNVFDQPPPEDEMPEDGMKRFVMQFMQFEKCFNPKFAQVCGINNQLSEFFCPMLNKETIKTMVATFLQSGGAQAQMLMGYVKEKLESFMM